VKRFEAAGSRVGSQTGIHCEFKASFGKIRRLSLKNRKNPNILCTKLIKLYFRFYSESLEGR
jgi:hypothetical protein